MFLFGISASVQASTFTNLPFVNEFEHYGWDALDWADYGDEYNTGSTALNFSVTVGGATYTHFDMDSNGYVELLTDEDDDPTEYGGDYIDNLIMEDPYSTYLLAAYDNLSSDEYGYFGYKLFGDGAVFYYETETYADEGNYILNNFEVFLYDDGRVQWNFNYADYYYEADDYYDLFSGLYFGNTGTLLELARDGIPANESYLYNGTETIPEPATMMLLGSLATGLFGMAGIRRKFSKF